MDIIFSLPIKGVTKNQNTTTQKEFTFGMANAWKVSKNAA